MRYGWRTGPRSRRHCFVGRRPCNQNIGREVGSAGRKTYCARRLDRAFSIAPSTAARRLSRLRRAAILLPRRRSTAAPYNVRTRFRANSRTPTPPGFDRVGTKSGGGRQPGTAERFSSAFGSAALRINRICGRPRDYKRHARSVRSTLNISALRRGVSSAGRRLKVTGSTESSAAFGAADGMPEGGAIEIFAPVHEGKESIENARLQFVWKVESTGCSASQ